MHIKELPFEIASKILVEVAEANAHHGPTFTFGLTQAPLPLQKTTLQRYVRGPVPPEMLKWDATSAIRHVCWQWHEWATRYALKSVSVSRRKGGERWAELSNRRSSYSLYELIHHPSGTAVYRDPLALLKQTANTFNDFPELASKIQRLWFHDFYTAETNRLIFASLRNCKNLTSLSVPWTAIRHLDSKIWQSLITGQDSPLESLELQCLEPTAQQAAEKENQTDLEPLRAVDFGLLRRLKIFGDTTSMPITDHDLFTIARTATRLEEFHMTSTSSITIEGVMAVVKASRDTLRVLEHSPRSQHGFWHPHPGPASRCEHLCDILRNCPKLETLSVSLPSVCADLFSRADANFSGTLQARALHVCGHEHDRSMPEAANALQRMLQEARSLTRRAATSSVPRSISMELFFADCIFEPSFGLVHGDFALAQISCSGSWPVSMRCSGKGPYGSTGVYEKDIEGPFQCIDEDEFLNGVRRGLHSISHQSLAEMLPPLL